MAGLQHVMKASYIHLLMSYSTVLLLSIFGIAHGAHIQPDADSEGEDLRITVVPTEPSHRVDVQGVPVYIGSLNNGNKRSNYMYLDETGLRNCTGHGATCEPIIDNTWKTKIIIGCTVAAAIEIFIVLLLVLYWKQIRWTLRKISCPCESCFQNQRASHDRVQRANRNNQGTSLVDVELEYHGPSHAALLYARQTSTESQPGTSSEDRDEEEAEAEQSRQSNVGRKSRPSRNPPESDHDASDSEIGSGQSSLLYPGPSTSGQPTEAIASTSGVQMRSVETV